MATFLTGNTAVLPTAAGDTFWTWVGSPWGILTCYVVLMSLITFLVFGFDKLKAKYKETHESARRVPERTLFLLAILGGSPGALLGMKVWHHKTLHKSFRIGIPLILLAQIVIPLGLYLYVTVIR